MQSEWVAYTKTNIQRPETIVNYLARYTHKIAIDNHRLIDSDEQHVRFRYKDYRDHDKHKVMQLQSQEFIRRFLQHVLPMASCASVTTVFSPSAADGNGSWSSGTHCTHRKQHQQQRATPSPQDLRIPNPSVPAQNSLDIPSPAQYNPLYIKAAVPTRLSPTGIYTP